jgi:hypothetical protein
MIPSFTNEQRRRLYFNHPKRGFTYINWDIEEELWRFQKEIEQKFQLSDVNRNFKYPRLAVDEDDEEEIVNLRVSIGV